MKWEHKCDLGWLRKRQQYITASDIKNLLPITKTGRPRKVGDAEYLKVMANKMTMLTEEDCMSYGAAARGHLLEPYAIDALNMTLEQLNLNDHETFFHWDDEIVSVHGRQLAFSPDAMDIPMGADNPCTPHAIAEVKCYDAGKHLTLAYTPKDQMEERWQIASAMALCDTIDHAYLVLFNPKMRYRKLFVIRFDRSELESEIKTILEVERNWMEFRKTGPLTRRSVNEAIYSHHGGNEDTIYEEIVRKMNLNPV